MNACTRYGILFAFAAVACAHRTTIGQYVGQRLSTKPPAGPTCYWAASQLLTEQLDTSIAREPRWLVLDTRPDDEQPGYAVAYLITPEGHQRPSIFAQWRRVGDSLDVSETNTFPPARWVLADRGDSLVGRAVMVHDMVIRDSTGTPVLLRSEWPARAYRLSCAKVP